jgi:A/G-specific adenine glycosylase
MPRSQLRLKRIHKTLAEWFHAYSRDLPWRRTRDPYQILVSEVMLQQTQVDRVLPKYRAFLEQFPTLHDLAAAAPGDVIRAWAGLGYNRRALNLQRTAQAVRDEHAGQFPETPEELQRLPGIGPYTAGAVACFAFERDVAFMDTNIRRVIGRVFVGPDGDPPWNDRQLLEEAEAAMPRGNGYLWNQAIMELGALVCTASRPRCTICPLRSECRAYAGWIKADEQVFQVGPVARRATPAVAERQAPYTGSNRFYRGRIVALLRELPPGAAAPLDELGPRVKEGWTGEELPWLQKIAEALAAEGLVMLERSDGERLLLRLP